MPLGDAEASALQVTSGLVYETLIDCSDGTYRPALAESWDVSDDRMRLAVRVRSGVRWHDHRAFGVLDVQATLEPLLRKGNDAAALRAALADVASVELVTERTIRFVLKRPSDLVLRALCDMPILPEHIIRGVRGESAPIARQPIGTGPFRFAGWERGKRIRLERSADYWGTPPGVDEIVFDARRRRRARAESHAARRDRRAVARARRALPGAGRTDDAARRRGALPAGVAPLFVSRRQHAHTRRCPTRASGARSRCCGTASGSPASCTAISRARSAGRRSGTTCRRRRSIARARSRCSRKPATATATRTACAIATGKAIRLTMLEPAGNKLFNVEARAFVLEMRKAGVLVDLGVDRRRHDHAPPQARRVRPRADDLARGARRRPGRALRLRRRLQLRRATAPARSTR